MYPSMHADEPSLYPGLSITLTDRASISQFLRALRHAKQIVPVPNEIGSMMKQISLTISFRKTKRPYRDDLNLDFNSAHFGPEFQRAFDRLPTCFAHNATHIARAAAGRVVTVKFVGTKVSDPQEVARLVRALGQVDQSAFDLYYDLSDSFEVLLVLQDGSVRTIDLAPSKYTQKPMPAILMKYYKMIKRAERESARTSPSRARALQRLPGTTSIGPDVRVFS